MYNDKVYSQKGSEIDWESNLSGLQTKCARIYDVLKKDGGRCFIEAVFVTVTYDNKYQDRKDHENNR